MSFKDPRDIEERKKVIIELAGNVLNFKISKEVPNTVVTRSKSEAEIEFITIQIRHLVSAKNKHNIAKMSAYN